MGLEETTGLLYFSADWCGPCKQMKPVTEEIAEEYNLINVDVEERQDLANQYSVRSLPTFISLENGTVVDQHSGIAQKNELENMAPGS